jgi:uncharacterized membrane protein
VFIPNTPNPTSGYFRLLPETSVKPLDLTIEQAVKLIASAGVVQSPPSPEANPEPHGLTRVKPSSSARTCSATPAASR